MIPALETGPAFLGVVGLLAYVLGSVPFGIVMARAFGLGDLRKIGSGNIGATNVLRTGNKLAALLTLVLDAGKGAIAVLAARATLGEDAAQIAGVAAFLGHCYPIFIGFRGGKGVATFFGTVLALSWPLGLAACATWAVVAALFRISSLAGIVAALLGPIWAFVLGQPEAAAALAFMAVLIVLRHEGNIRRILDGTEPRIGRSRG
jgi:glycerol-3-phosphate acyltransferase PlsY